MERLKLNPTSPFWRRSALGFLWKEWCWSWNSSTLATSCEELTHWKRLWCWEGLGAGGEEADRGWVAGWHHWLDGHEFGWTPGVGDEQGGLACCNSWGRRVGYDWETELTDWYMYLFYFKFFFYFNTEYWAEFSVLYSRSLLVIYFKYSSVYMSSPNSRSVLPPPSSRTTCSWNFFF